MAHSIKLFILGLIISILITEFEDVENLDDLTEDTLNFLIISFSFSIFTKLGYYVLLAIILPFVAITALKKRLSERSIMVYSLLSGLTFGFAIISIITILVEIQTNLK